MKETGLMELGSGKPTFGENPAVFFFACFSFLAASFKTWPDSLTNRKLHNVCTRKLRIVDLSCHHAALIDEIKVEELQWFVETTQPASNFVDIDTAESYFFYISVCDKMNIWLMTWTLAWLQWPLSPCNHMGMARGSIIPTGRRSLSYRVSSLPTLVTRKFHFLVGLILIFFLHTPCIMTHSVRFLYSYICTCKFVYVCINIWEYSVCNRSGFTH